MESKFSYYEGQKIVKQYFQSAKRNKKPSQPKILYSAKLDFKSEDKIKTFSNKIKLRESISSILMLQGMLKEVI